MAINLNAGVRAQRKTLITVAEWTGASHDVYNKISDTSAPTWVANTFYSKGTDGAYTVLESQPDDWATNYKAYYKKTTSTNYREILGTRTEDSSIEFNPDIETSTDILGITYTDVNKTEPQQDFDPFYLLGGSDLGEYLASAALKNDITAYSNFCNVYVITAFISEGSGESTAYKAVMHEGCSIIPTSIGGDSYVSMPIEVHYSNKITEGTVDKLSSDFTFTAA